MLRHSFDDMLTSGKHLRVAEIRIRDLASHQAVIAVFIAHRMPSSAAGACSC
jgi:hypothetical protein